MRSTLHCCCCFNNLRRVRIFHRLHVCKWLAQSGNLCRGVVEAVAYSLYLTGMYERFVALYVHYDIAVGSILLTASSILSVPLLWSALVMTAFRQSRQPHRKCAGRQWQRKPRPMLMLQHRKRA